MGFIKEFGAFVKRGNVIDLAVAVVLGGAFNEIVKKVVDGVVMPLVTAFLPADQAWATWKVGPLAVGQVISATLNFLIIAMVIFIVVNKVMKRFDKPGEAPAAPPPPPEDVVLLREIRDLLKQQR